MKKTIAVIPGDGVGPEIVREAVKVLKVVAGKFGHEFEMTQYPVGGAAYDLCGDCLPDETLNACKSADAVLLGCTELPLMIKDGELDVPLLNTTQIHINAIFDAAK